MDQPQFTVDELGERWGRLLSQSLAQIITLEKQVKMHQAEIAELHSRLHNAERSIAAQRDAIKEKATPQDG